MSEEPAARLRARELWDAQTRVNAKVAILDTPEVRDPARAEEAFWRAGREDARRLEAFFAPGARVLDLGCGMGRVLRYLAPRAGEALGVDISREMLDRAEEACAGVPKLRFLLSPGASLDGVETGSIDFFYSLLCLIHVDRRSAYRYLAEAQRVLRPGGLAFLQFQDIATEQGLSKFRGVLDLDYPLEFYTEGELRFLLASVGLDVLCSFGEAEYLYFTVLNGEAAAWRARLAAGVSSEGLATDPAGGLRVTLRSTLPSVQPLRLELCVTRTGRPLRVHEGVLDLAPGVTQLEVRRAGPGSDPSARAGGRTLELTSLYDAPADTGAGGLNFHAALLPPGFQHTAEFEAEFPGLACSWRSA